MTTEFRKPVKCINSPDDLNKFTISPVCKAYIAWLTEVSEAVKGKKLSDTDYPVSDATQKILDKLETLKVWVDEIPPIEQPMRFGNKAFRIWMDRMEQNAEDMMRDILPDDLKAAAIELSAYWQNSFGNKTRIDYGTGHETFFVVWLYCLEVIGVLKPEDRVALVFKVFQNYLLLMRKVQRTYMLEPAGSHGVWSLDDYQFLPFYFGSSQLIGHKEILPKSIRQKDIIEYYAPDFMYLQAVQFVLTVKSGPFSEHSPMLNSIAEVPSWEKVNQGLMKMYMAEVLGKFPIMQHFLFGTIFPYPS